MRLKVPFARAECAFKPVSIPRKGWIVMEDPNGWYVDHDHHLGSAFSSLAVTDSQTVSPAVEVFGTAPEACEALVLCQSGFHFRQTRPWNSVGHFGRGRRKISDNQGRSLEGRSPHAGPISEQIKNSQLFSDRKRKRVEQSYQAGQGGFVKTFWEEVGGSPGESNAIPVHCPRTCGVKSSRLQEIIDSLQRELANLGQPPRLTLLEGDEDVSADLPHKNSIVGPQTPLALTVGAPRTPIAITGGHEVAATFHVEVEEFSFCGLCEAVVLVRHRIQVRCRWEFLSDRQRCVRTCCQVRGPFFAVQVFSH